MRAKKIRDQRETEQKELVSFRKIYKALVDNPPANVKGSYKLQKTLAISRKLLWEFLKRKRKTRRAKPIFQKGKLTSRYKMFAMF